MQPRRLRPSLFGRGVDRPVEGRARSLFFNGAWIYGSAALLVVGMASGNQALTLLALFVLVTAGLARVWNHFSLTRVSYTRTLSATRALPDDTVTLTLTLVNRKLLPLPWLAIEDELSDGVRVLDREAMPSGTPGPANHPHLHRRPAVRACQLADCAPLPGPRRAQLRAGHAPLRRPLRLLQQPALGVVEDQLLVYPRVVSLKDLGLPPRRPFGETRVVRHLLTDPTRVVGVRDYRPEDPFRAIHWKATARQGNLQVRVYEPTTMLQFGIFVNLDTFDHYWEGLDIELSEIAIVIAASIADWADQQRYAVGVYAERAHTRVGSGPAGPPGRAAGQLTEILEGLAKVTPYSTLNFARTLRLEAVRFPWGSTDRHHYLATLRHVDWSPRRVDRGWPAVVLIPMESVRCLRCVA